MSEATTALFSDPEALAAGVADWLLARSMDRPEAPFAVALSGGSTPRRLYERLAEAPLRDRFPWDRTHWFLGDERFVPPDDPKSNLRMVREAMLSKVPVPTEYIHPVPTVGLDPIDAARAYQRALAAFYGADRLDPARPLFDVTLLGLGTDGHTASLFPGTAALEERTAWVTAVVGAMPEPRITLTYPALDSSRHVAFLIAGADKRAIYDRFRGGDMALPAARVNPVGQRIVFVDTAATGDRP